MKILSPIQILFSIYTLTLFLIPTLYAHDKDNLLVADSIARMSFQQTGGFGHSIVTGDFNGDLIDDLAISSIIGANSILNILFFWGGPNTDTNPDFEFTIGFVSDPHYGYSIANSGDVNNDGFDDLLIGLPEYNNYQGKALLFLGGNPMDSLPDRVFYGEQDYLQIGIQVSTAGDINNDGFDDFLVGVCRDNFWRVDTSRVLLFLGGNDFDIVPDLIFFSENTDDYFGTSLASVGDLNNDGFDDIAIGSKSVENKVFIYLGSEFTDDIPDLVLQNFIPESRFGFSACGNIDLNKDGFIDLIIGAPYFSIGTRYETGRVYVYFGGNQFDSEPDLIIDGQYTFGFFGFMISSAGYFNDDNYPDLVIGSPGANNFWGKIYILYGGESVTGQPDIILSGDYTDAFKFGSCILNCDFNYDGFSEILVGSYAIEMTTGNLILGNGRASLYYFVPNRKIEYSATNFIFEEPNAFTFDVYIKNIGESKWTYGSGNIAFTFNQWILYSDSLLFSIVPGFSEFPTSHQPDSVYRISPNILCTNSNLITEGPIIMPGERLRYARIRLQTIDSVFTLQQHFIRFKKTGVPKVQTFWWYWNSDDGYEFEDVNKFYIELPAHLVPVELISFTAKSLGSSIILKWITGSELNNNGFEIQRSINESDFITIGFVRGEGTTSGNKGYSFIDKELSNGKYFYRLKQLDFNGNYEFSDVIEVEFRRLVEFILEQNYPNPFNPSTLIKFTLPKSELVTLKVYDLLGAEVTTIVNQQLEAGYYKYDWNASGYASGMYIYRLQAGEFTSVKKMIILK